MLKERRYLQEASPEQVRMLVEELEQLLKASVRIQVRLP
jgi:hypothetical protein